MVDQISETLPNGKDSRHTHQHPKPRQQQHLVARSAVAGMHATWQTIWRTSASWIKALGTKDRQAWEHVEQACRPGTGGYQKQLSWHLAEQAPGTSVWTGVRGITARMDEHGPRVKEET